MTVTSPGDSLLVVFSVLDASTKMNIMDIPTQQSTVQSLHVTRRGKILIAQIHILIKVEVECVQWRKT